ncbi:right-handed parallel beta-helix repeat-containing protein [Pseudonocardia sichuanensis]
MTGRHRRRRDAGRLLAGCAVVGLAGLLLGTQALPGTAGAAPEPVAAPQAAAPTAAQQLPLLAARPAQPPEPDPDGSSGPSAAQRARAEAAERAAERARKRAEAAAKARRTWDSRGRPHRLVIVRDNRIEAVTDGELTRQVHRQGTATLATLDRALPSSWLTVTDGTAVLGAAVVLTRGASLEIGGGDIRTLVLQGGPTPQDAASLYTGGGEVALNAVTITSVDAASGQPLPPTVPGRPFLVVSEGGRLDAVDSTISDLGTPSGGLDGGDPGVVFNRGSSGSLVRTTFQRNTTGLELSRSEGVHLEQVTVSDSAADGLVLSGDRGTTMSGIRAIGNGENGVMVTGESSDRPVSGIVTTGNGGYGVVVIGQTGMRLSGIATASDEAGGLRVNRSTDVHVTDFTATDQPTAVFTHVGSTGVVLDHLRVVGGRRGVVAEKSTHDLELRTSSIEGSRVAGVSIGGSEILVSDVEIADTRAGVRVERGASGVRLAGLTLTGGRDGIVATPGTHGVVIADLVANHVEADAIRSGSVGAEIIGGRITGGATGIDVAGGATIAGTSISGAREGIHSRAPELVRADGVTIDALELGIESAPGSPFLLTDSSVHALEALRGQIAQQGDNNLSLPPLNLLGAIGVPLILLAVVLEQVHSTRQRRVGVHGRRLPPAVPVGAG